MEDEPELEHSSLSQSITSGDDTVHVEIYRFVGDTEWLLEVVDAFNNSTVWNDRFQSHEAAVSEVNKTIQCEGVGVLIGPVDGKDEW